VSIQMLPTLSYLLYFFSLVLILNSDCIELQKREKWKRRERLRDVFLNKYCSLNWTILKKAVTISESTKMFIFLSEKRERERERERQYKRQYITDTIMENRQELYYKRLLRISAFPLWLQSQKWMIKFSSWDKLMGHILQYIPLKLMRFR
jgi:hypothetical protein